MEFRINVEPPTPDMIARERAHLSSEIKRIKLIDTLISFALILLSSLILGFVLYTSLDNLVYALIGATVFPIIAIVLSQIGITSVHGFRSAEMRLIELSNALISLSSVAPGHRDVAELCNRYTNVNAYKAMVERMGRDLVNGELAMFWDWDSSTGAKADKAKAYVNRR